MTDDPVDAILDFHGIKGAWEPLQATGVANRVYATKEIVLRIATEHPDAVADARTESVAAPAAFRAGVRTPHLVAFNDYRNLVERPYSIWERVHAETLGLVDLAPSQGDEIWRQVGNEISRLHSNVSSCADPNGYLDTPAREFGLNSQLEQLARSERVDRVILEEIELLIRDLSPHVSKTYPRFFVHNDLHAMNIMSQGDQLRALLDWGDAGWGDPTLDFAALPLAHLQAVREGYEESNRMALDEAPEARFIWDQLHRALKHANRKRGYEIPLRDFRRFLDAAH